MDLKQTSRDIFRLEAQRVTWFEVTCKKFCNFYGQNGGIYFGYALNDKDNIYAISVTFTG